MIESFRIGAGQGEEARALRLGQFGRIHRGARGNIDHQRIQPGAGKSFGAGLRIFARARTAGGAIHGRLVGGIVAPVVVVNAEIGLELGILIAVDDLQD